MYDGTTWSKTSIAPSLDANKLYFSGLGEPTLWSDLDYLLFPKPIVAIGSTANGLVVFAYNAIYTVLGTTLNEFSIITLSEKDGCVSNTSVQAYKGQLLFVGLHGIQQTNGGSIQNVSRPLLKQLDTIVTSFSALVDDVYYVETPTSILAYDFRAAKLFKTFDKTGITGMSNIDGVLELCYNGRLSTAFAGDLQPLKYTSGLQTLGVVNNLKEFQSVWIRYTGTMRLTVTIDDLVVGSFQVASSSVTTHKYLIPKTLAKGYAMQFGVTGVGRVLAIEFMHNLRKN